MKALQSCLFFLVILLFTSQISFANTPSNNHQSKNEFTKEELNWIKNNPKIIVGNELYTAPFSFNIDGKPKGYFIDFLEIVSQKTDLSFEFISGYTWFELFELFKENKLDLLQPATKTKERESNWLFSQPIAADPMHYATHEDTEKIGTIKELFGKKIVVPKGYYQEEYLKRKYPEINTISAKNVKEGLELVSNKEAYAIIESKHVINYNTKRNYIKHIKINNIVQEFNKDNKAALHYITHKDKPLLISIINKVQNSLSSEEKNYLKKRWLLDKKSINISPQTMGEEKRIISALTNKEKAFLAEHPIIRVSNELDWPPFDFTVNNQPQGYFIDLLKIIEKRVDTKFEFVNGYTWDELFNMYKNKEIDLIHPLEKIFTNESDSLVSDPIFLYNSAYATKSSTPRITSIKDLFGKKVAVGKGFGLEIFLKEKYPKVSLLLVNNVKEGLEAVASGRAYALIDSKYVMKYIIRKELFSNITIQGLFKEHDKDEFRSLHIMTHDDKPELMSIINKALATITPGEIAGLEEKWFGEKSSLSEERINLTMSEFSYLKRKEELNVCIIPKFMPYEALDENGNHVGVTKDIVALLEKKIGTPITLYNTKTFDESIEAIKSNQCDFLPLAQNLKSRRSFLNFTAPYITTPTGIATKNNNLFIYDLKDIANKKIGVTRKSAYYEIIKERYPMIDLVRLANVEEGLKKIDSGEIYAYVGSLGNLGYHIQKQANYDIKIAGKLDFDLHLSIASRADEPKLNSIFKKALKSISEEEITKAYGKWVSVKVEHQIDYSLIYKVVGIALLIILGTLWWSHKLRQEINKRKEIEKQLIIARQEALNASQAKSEFLANMSHEIRTPMNGILGMTTLALAKMDKDVDVAKDFIKKGQNSAKMLLGIINDILDFSKIEARKLEICHEQINLREIISQINDLFSYTSTQKDLAFIIEQDQLTPEYIMGDQLRLIQVLTNLISNAIKFTDQGSVKLKIELVSKDENRIQLKFSIIDTGKGIPQDKQSRLFQSFTQEDSSISREFGGTGLGLVISKNLVELMNGKISFTSEENKGSTFSFTIDTELIEDEVAIIKERSHSKTKEFNILNQQVLSAHILLVEDNETNRELAYNFLNEIVSDIDMVTNGQEAVDKLLEKGSDYYQLVLMDIHMPLMDGYTATQTIKKHEAFKNLPVVALTANVLKNDLEKCFNAGMCDHIPKPFDVKEFYKKVRFWIQSHGKRKSISKEPIEITAISEETLNTTEAIKRMVQREDLYQKFLEGFLKNRTQDINTLKEALNNKEQEQAQTLLHTLKGVLGTMGADRLRTLVMTAENKLKEGSALSNEELALLQKEMNQLVKTVEAWIVNKTSVNMKE